MASPKVSTVDTNGETPGTVTGSPTLTQMLLNRKPQTPFQYPGRSSSTKGCSSPRITSGTSHQIPASEPPNRFSNRSGTRSLGIRRRLRSTENFASPCLQRKRSCLDIDNLDAKKSKTITIKQNLGTDASRLHNKTEQSNSNGNKLKGNLYTKEVSDSPKSGDASCITNPVGANQHNHSKCSVIGSNEASASDCANDLSSDLSLVGGSSETRSKIVNGKTIAISMKTLDNAVSMVEECRNGNELHVIKPDNDELNLYSENTNQQKPLNNIISNGESSTKSEYQESNPICTSPVLRSTRSSLRKRLKRRRILRGKQTADAKSLPQNEKCKPPAEGADSSFLSDGLDSEMLAVDLNEKFDAECGKEAEDGHMLMGHGTNNDSQHMPTAKSIPVNLDIKHEPLSYDCIRSDMPHYKNPPNKPATSDSDETKKLYTERKLCSETKQATPPVVEKSNHTPNTYPVACRTKSSIDKLFGTQPPNKSIESHPISNKPCKATKVQNSDPENSATIGFNEDEDMHVDDELLAKIGEELEQKQHCDSEKSCTDSVNFPGFKTASKKTIHVTGTAMEKARNMLGLENELISPDEKKSQKIIDKQNSTDDNSHKISKSMMDFVKNFLEPSKANRTSERDASHVLQKTDTPGTSSSKISNKPIYEDAVKKVGNKSLGKRSEVPSHKNFVSFQTASNKPLTVSDSAMKRAQSLLAEDKSELQPSGGNFVGFRTASNKALMISNEAIKKAESLLCEDLSDCADKDGNSESYVGFRTASNKVLIISDEAIKKAESLLGENLLNCATKGNSEDFVGFKTASNKPLAVSAAAMEKANILLADERPCTSKESENDRTKISSSRIPALTNVFKSGSLTAGKRNKDFKTPRNSTIPINRESSVHHNVPEKDLPPALPSPKKILGIKHHGESQIVVSDESLVKAVEMLEDLFS